MNSPKHCLYNLMHFFKKYCNVSLKNLKSLCTHICIHYEILALKITLKNLEWLRKSMKLPKTKEFSNPEIFQRYFSAFSVLNLLPIMSTEIHLNHPKWFFAWLHCKTSQYFFSVISSFSVWLAKCKNQYLNNKDKFSVWFSVFFQCRFLLY